MCYFAVYLFYIFVLLLLVVVFYDHFTDFIAIIIIVIFYLFVGLRYEYNVSSLVIGHAPATPPARLYKRGARALRSLSPVAFRPQDPLHERLIESVRCVFGFISALSFPSFVS